MNIDTDRVSFTVVRFYTHNMISNKTYTQKSEKAIFDLLSCLYFAIISHINI